MIFLNVITDSYYKVYNNDMLLSVFNDVIVNNNDYLRNERIKKYFAFKYYSK